MASHIHTSAHKHSSRSFPSLPTPCHIQLLRSAGPHRPVNSLRPFLGGALLSGFFSCSSDSSCLFVWLQVPGAIRQGAWSFEEQGVVASALWGTSESWIKGIPDPTASVLPNPAVKRKGHLLSSSEAVGRGTPKRRLQDYKQKEGTGHKSLRVISATLMDSSRVSSQGWRVLVSLCRQPCTQQSLRKTLPGLTLTACTTILQDCSALYLCLI